MSDEKMISLIPRDKDEVKFQISRKIAIDLSGFLKEALNEDDEDDIPDDIDIPVPNVAEDVLEKVVEFMKHYAEEEMTAIATPLRSDKLEEMVQPWYSDFAKVPRPMLFDLVAAANFMDVKPLLDLTCLATSILIKGKSADELRQMFNVSADAMAEDAPVENGTAAESAA